MCFSSLLISSYFCFYFLYFFFVHLNVSYAIKSAWMRIPKVDYQAIHQHQTKVSERQLKISWIHYHWIRKIALIPENEPNLCRYLHRTTSNNQNKPKQKILITKNVNCRKTKLRVRACACVIFEQKYQKQNKKKISFTSVVISPSPSSSSSFYKCNAILCQSKAKNTHTEGVRTRE